MSELRCIKKMQKCQTRKCKATKNTKHVNIQNNQMEKYKKCKISKQQKHEIQNYKQKSVIAINTASQKMQIVLKLGKYFSQPIM